MNGFKNKASPLTGEGVLKTTALLYFKESLWKEVFENSGELAGFARQFGAGPNEISEVITDYLGGINAGTYGAHRSKNRLNLLKEEIG